MKRIKKDDEVIVIAGKDKGRRGKVLSVGGDRVTVENVNVAKKAVNPDPNTGEAGGIVEKEMPLHLSNVMVFNPGSGKGDRIGFKRLDDGKKVRYFKSSDEQVG